MNVSEKIISNQISELLLVRIGYFICCNLTFNFFSRILFKYNSWLYLTCGLLCNSNNSSNYKFKFIAINNNISFSSFLYNAHEAMKWKGEKVTKWVLSEKVIKELSKNLKNSS